MSGFDRTLRTWSLTLKTHFLIENESKENSELPDPHIEEKQSSNEGWILFSEQKLELQETSGRRKKANATIISIVAK